MKCANTYLGSEDAITEVTAAAKESKYLTYILTD